MSWFLDGRRISSDRRHQMEEHGILVVLRIIDMEFQVTEINIFFNRDKHLRFALKRFLLGLGLDIKHQMKYIDGSVLLREQD